ncbi:Gfo/Idh/MocA family protein [Microbacterium sp. C7(2022)]|uniref:Gfo/Idh/MocA family protein n=1 Tax=Microbacterium sp. C7(2022) TaxID=2992759 RepID=UPI00237A43CA|nr:Gfo/Idh/MocA family oxidoreductase [Microbacterium sp. C7(2022)]MDE0546697.1 Gfo/Idh/MocA family oxidoreductase [Microbacterium sp. C7(2022)]
MLAWGIIGTGDISERVIADLTGLPGVRITAVWGRTAERADEFARSHGIPFATASRDELLARADVDVVYIATPAHTHADIAIEALAAGKHVLIEKPIATSADDAARVYAAATAAGRFAMEAMWMRFNPLHVEVLDRIRDGALGEISSVRASFGTPFQARGRVLTPAQSGSILRDRGIYPVTFAHWFLGAPESIVATGVFDEGVDIDGHTTTEHGAAFAQLAWSGIRFLDLTATVSGEYGWITIDPMFWAGSRARVHAGSVQKIFGSPEMVEHPREGNGYGPILAAVTEAIGRGELEHPWHTHAESLAITRTLDAVLATMTATARSVR